MNNNPDQIEATIAALEAQRGLLGDTVVNSALAPLRRELATLRAAAKVPQQQLKQVSVLFVDVVGSTAMGQMLQPEDIHAVMDGALERFTAIVTRHRGRVLQYTGDGMLAAFGTDAANEDDAESAVLAGLGILEEARRHAPQVLLEHGIPDFNVRAGINTGTVLLGGGVDAEGSIRGAVVNVAARMEQSAPVGSLRISHDTYRHVRGAFETAEQIPLSVKGVAAPVRSYLVYRARSRALRGTGRGVDGVDTGMIGRDRELTFLRHTLDSVAGRRALLAVTVIGDAGLGKSRLLDEFQSGLLVHHSNCTLLQARAQPRSALQPYDLLRDLVTRHLDISDAESATAARTKLTDGLVPLFADEGEAPAHLIGHLIGLDFSSSPHVARVLHDALQIRDLAFAATATFLRRLARQRHAPIVMVLDDLHWADEGSLDLLQHLLISNRDTALMMLMLTRPDLLARRDNWVRDAQTHARIDLRPLGKVESTQLAEALLQRLAQIPASIRTLIIDAAEGNPFYMEELVKMMIDDGVIAADGEGWRIQNDKLLALHVPPTLTGVLQVRLDALAAPDRVALQQAAVIGHVFSDQTLAVIDPMATQALPALLHRQLIVAHGPPGPDGVSEFAFQHNLLHQVTYDGVLRGPKRSGHQKIGAYWTAKAEVRAPQDVSPANCRALVETHYHRCLSDPREYVGWFDAQFSVYLKAYAAQALQPLAEGVVAVCETQFGRGDPQTAKALTNVARALVTLGDANPAEALLRRAITIQEEALEPDHPDTARTAAVLGGVFVGRGDHTAAEPLIRRSLAIRERTLGPEHPLTISTLSQLASTLGELGRNDEAESLSRRVLEVRERLLGPDHPDTCFALTALGDVLSKKNDHAAAEPLIRRALTAQQRTLPPEHPDTGLSMWNLAEALRGLGRHQEAEPLARGSLQMWEKTLGPQHEWTAWSLGSLAKLRLAQGDAADAAELAERALSIHEKSFGANHTTVAETLQLLGRALVDQGDHVRAQPLLERALEIQCDHLGVGDAATSETRALLARMQELRPAPADAVVDGRRRPAASSSIDPPG